nr:MAG TPA: hypothetical protein [Caudoviricetes sp.]
MAGFDIRKDAGSLVGVLSMRAVWITLGAIGILGGRHSRKHGNDGSNTRCENGTDERD